MFAFGCDLESWVTAGSRTVLPLSRKLRASISKWARTHGLVVDLLRN
jgi:hypothetical protein